MPWAGEIPIKFASHDAVGESNWDSEALSKKEHLQNHQAVPNIVIYGEEPPSLSSGTHNYSIGQKYSAPYKKGSVSDMACPMGADTEWEEEHEGEDEGQACIEQWKLPSQNTGPMLFSIASYEDRQPNLAANTTQGDLMRIGASRRVSECLRERRESENVEGHMTKMIKWSRKCTQGCKGLRL